MNSRMRLEMKTPTLGWSELPSSSTSCSFRFTPRGGIVIQRPEYDGTSGYAYIQISNQTRRAHTSNVPVSTTTSRNPRLFKKPASALQISDHQSSYNVHDDADSSIISSMPLSSSGSSFGINRGAPGTRPSNGASGGCSMFSARLSGGRRNTTHGRPSR